MTDCIPWTGRLTEEGYGRLGSRLAHRLAYEKARGSIPEGMTVDHLCFNPSCVNPEHMRLLTLSENARNQRSATKAECINGHEFTPENTYARPARYRSGKRDCRACIRERARRYQARLRAAA